MSASDKPCTPLRYEQSPGAQPLSPNKKRRKPQRSNSTVQSAQSAAAAQASDAMPLTPSSAGSMKMMDSDAAVTAAAVGPGGMMPLQRNPYDDPGSMRAMQAAMGSQQQQMMAAMQQQQQQQHQYIAGHQRHPAYPGGRPMMAGATDHMLQPQQGMSQGGRPTMGHAGMLTGQSMMPYGSYATGNYCGVCRNEVQDYSQAIMCGSGCSLWFHVQCSGLNDFAYQLLSKEANAEWACDPCFKQKGQLVKLRMGQHS